MNDLLVFLMLALAIEKFTDLMTTVDLLDRPREWFSRKFPRIKKLAECKFCQTFWVSGMVSFFFPFRLLEDAGLGWKVGVLWLSLFGVALFFDEFFHRYLNGAPLRVRLDKDDPTDEEDPGP